jgi:hypothetical protein
MLSSSSLDLNRNRTMRSPSDRVNALKRGSIRGVQGLLNNPYNGSFAASDGRLSPTPSYATSINEVSCDSGGGPGSGPFRADDDRPPPRLPLRSVLHPTCPTRSSGSTRTRWRRWTRTRPSRPSMRWTMTSWPSSAPRGQRKACSSTSSTGRARVRGPRRTSGSSSSSSCRRASCSCSRLGTEAAQDSQGVRWEVGTGL